MKPLRVVALWAALGLPGCADGKDARRAGDLDAARADAHAEASRRDGEGACAAHCAGRCLASGCLTTLAVAPRPTRLVLDGANAYFTACDGGGSLRRVPFDAGAAVELAHGSTCPTDLAIRDDAVYVAALDGNGVTRVPLSGGAPTNGFAGGPAFVVDAGTPLTGIAVDGSAVYATTTTGVLEAPLGGGVFTPLATIAGQRAATRPVMDEQSVYFGDPELGAVYRVSKDGGDVTTLAAGLGGVEALALAGSTLYAGAGYVVVKLPVSGGAPVTLGTAAGAEVLALAVDGSGVYFTSSGVVWMLPLGGGSPAALASDDGDLDAIATNGDGLFWTASRTCDASDCAGAVRRLRLK